MDDRKIQIFLDTLLPLLKAGVAFTIPLALLSFVLGLILAILTALARLSPWVIPKLIARFYVWVIRGTPLLVQLFIIFLVCRLLVLYSTLHCRHHWIYP